MTAENLPEIIKVNSVTIIKNGCGERIRCLNGKAFDVPVSDLGNIRADEIWIDHSGGRTTVNLRDLK